MVDGDTFHIERDGRDVTVRLIGIDAPEVGWYGGTPECFGNRAGTLAAALLEGRRVRLEHDAERLDRFGRALAYAYLPGGRMVNVILVRRGLARVTIFRPNDRYEDRLRGAEEAASRAGAGLWSACR